jgi:hypothetical protein
MNGRYILDANGKQWYLVVYSTVNSTVTSAEAKEGHLKMVERVLATKNSRDISFEEG